MTATSDNRTSSPCPNATPRALLVWNNQSRLSLSPQLTIWLTFLVSVCIASVFFAGERVAARWVLGGFVVSHLIVFLLPAITKFTMRRGFVSLMHVVCWSPGLVMVCLDSSGRQANAIYEAWSYALITVISLSFLFDVRDAGEYVYYLFKGRVRSSGAMNDSGQPKS